MVSVVEKAAVIAGEVPLRHELNVPAAGIVNGLEGHMIRAFAAWYLIATSLGAVEPIRQVTSQVTLAGNQPEPAFYNGYVYWIEPGNRSFLLYAPDGRRALAASISSATPEPILTANLAIDTDGTIAVSRAYGGGIAPGSAIDLFEANGRPLGSIGTGLYAATQVTFGPDHTVWAFGWEWSPGKPAFVRATTDYMTVRQFSRDGRQMGAWLPRSTFPKGLEPASESWQARRITVIEDRVGLLATSGTRGDQQEWVELDLAG